MMTTLTGGPASRRPWHLWAVGGLGALWNIYGCLDYTMTALQGEVWLKSQGMTDAAIAFTLEMPAWMTAVWAIGVWGGMAGCLLLLLRSQWAFLVFVASLAAYVTSLFYQMVLTNGSDLMPESSWIIQTVILFICLSLVWYARMATRRGILR